MYSLATPDAVSSGPECDRAFVDGSHVSLGRKNLTWRQSLHRPDEAADMVARSKVFPYRQTRDAPDCVEDEVVQSFFMQRDPGIPVEADDKLHWLRRLDHDHDWKFLDEERYCLRCGRTFTGRQARLVGGTRPHGPLRFRCPTTGCPSTPRDWVPDNAKGHQVRFWPSTLISRLFHFGYRKNVWPRRSPVGLTTWKQRHPTLRSLSALFHYFGLAL